MPHTTRMLVRQGVNLTEAVAPTPICVPARASLLTGQYTHNHGALTISGEGGGFKAFRDRNTLPVWLRRAGYDTFFAGKYLNGYGVHNRRYVPPGWSQWRGSIDPSTYAIVNTKYNVNGRVRSDSRHNSDVLRDFSRSFLGSRAGRTRPWFMWVNYVAPHSGGRVESDDPRGFKTTLPAARHRNDFRRLELPRHPDLFVSDNSMWNAPRDLSERRRAVREVYQQRIESLRSVDEAVRGTLRRLREIGQLGNTYVIFSSDNGYLTGHHNRIGKLAPYNRSLRIPLVVRGPGIPAGTRSRTPTTNPDLAVTIAGLAGATPGRTVDGVDMLPYWRSSRTWQRVVPIEAYPVDGATHRKYAGIRFGRYTYSQNRGGREALFDRAAHPGETRDVSRKASYADVMEQMRAWNRRYRDCRGATCPKQDTFVEVP
jgi:arylsulfatase A-like enzyme